MSKKKKQTKKKYFEKFDKKKYLEELEEKKKLKALKKKKRQKVRERIKGKRIQRKIIRNKAYSKTRFNKFFRLRKKIKLKITIKLTSNNVYCTLIDLLVNKTKIVVSAGKCNNFNVSKKTLKIKAIEIIKFFIKKVKKKINTDEIIIVKFSGPIRLRKKILLQIVKLKSKKKLILLFKYNAIKCYNGCQPKKKKRKKRKGLTILK